MQILNQKRNITHAKRWGNSKALLYRVLEGSLRTFIKELCVTLFQSRDEIHEARRKLYCMK